jgi:hypothetical protein
MNSGVLTRAISWHLQFRSQAYKTPGTTPAVAAGVELERRSLERVVDIQAASITALR